MAEVPILVCVEGDLAGTKIRVPEGGLDMGRAEENHVVIRDEGVSRFHARLLYDNGSLWLQDAGSRNGVFRNGLRVTSHQALKVGDTLTIAKHTFKVAWDDGSESVVEKAAAVDGGDDAPTADTDSAPESDDPDKKKPWYWPF